MHHQWNAAEILTLISAALIAVEATLAGRGMTAKNLWARLEGAARHGAAKDGESLAAR